MAERPALSVVMPVHRMHDGLAAARARVHAAAAPHELLIVLNDSSLSGSVRAEHPSDRILACARKGRGFALAAGVAQARGGIVLLLHSDTLLPAGYDAAVLRTLSDIRVVGGGFHLAFDRPSPFLGFILRFSDLLVFLGGAMWGDRALFARAEVLRDCLPALNVPLFEDVRLSKALRKRGRLALLDQVVVTSAGHFHRNGPVTQTLRIVKARTWYAAGGEPQKIYDYYYSR